MKIGYIRVSKSKQHTERQYAALEPLALERLYEEKRSGKNTERPELQSMLENLREGDIVYIESLSRLGRNLRDLYALVERINSAGASVVSLKESLDFSTAQGRLMFAIFAALSEFERDLIVQRTEEGLAAAREKGHMGGRPRTDAKAIDRARKLAASGVSVAEACKAVGVSRSVYYRSV